MSVRLYREYKLKFYLNARHYIIINGKNGETHSHTWEFALNIKFGRTSFVQFNIFEKGISDYLARYQNKVLNEEEPFDTILPTVENMVDYFADIFYQIIHDIGGVLTQIEASETPTRSYILNLEATGEDSARSKEADDAILSDVMDAVLDQIVEEP